MSGPECGPLLTPLHPLLPDAVDQIVFIEMSDIRDTECEQIVQRDRSAASP